MVHNNFLSAGHKSPRHNQPTSAVLEWRYPGYPQDSTRFPKKSITWDAQGIWITPYTQEQHLQKVQ